MSTFQSHTKIVNGEETAAHIVNQSCIDYVRQSYEVETPVFDFIFCDPPFNIGHDYDVYDDRVSENEFIDFIASFIGSAVYVLKDTGILCIHVPDSMVMHVLNAAYALGLYRVEWIIWHYRFGQCQKEHFIRSKCHCLIFTFSPQNYTFNAKDVLVQTDRSRIYGDDRTLDSDTPGMRVPLDVWCTEYDGKFWSRVTGNSKERFPNHPNQLPEVYLQRLILAFTNQGDWCFDMFSGTGTMPTVAIEYGRNCIATELSHSYYEDINLRISQIGMIRK